MSEAAPKVLLLVLRRTGEEIDTLETALRRLVVAVPAKADLRASAYFRTSTSAAALLLEAREPGFDPEKALAEVPDLARDRIVRPLITERGPAQAMLSGFDVHLGDRLDPIDALTIIQEAARSDSGPTQERRRARRFPAPGDLQATLTVEKTVHRGPVSNVALSGCFVELPSPFPPPDSITSVVLQGQGPEVRLTARVVFALDKQQSHGLRRSPGVGLKFLSLAAHGRERLLRLVEAAATQAGLQGKDRRTERRFPVRLRIAIHGPEEVEHLLTQNVSSGGLFLKTHHPPPKGTRLQLDLQLPGNDAPLSVVGIVRHHASQDDGSIGIGIAFDSLDDGTVEMLEGYLGRVADRHRLRVLLVDDTRFFRAVLGDALREEGYEVLEARDGIDGMRKLSEEILTLDLLILDLDLPGMSGNEIIERLRSVGGESDLPVLILSGTVDFEIGAGLANRKNADFLSKETSTPEILATVEKLLAR